MDFDYERAWNELLVLLDDVSKVCTQINISKLKDYMEDIKSKIDYDDFSGDYF